MQGLSTCCVQQRFSVTRCCESNDKKSRRRRTREERRTMVESFINKYRKSNHGKFPSLNLTHKEVGGSFYIVREIVRDIIQENRVLGPGGPNMKVLTLQDCLEEHEMEYFNLNSENELSESSTVSIADEMQKQICSQPNRSNRSAVLGKPDSDELNASEHNNFMISDLLCNGSNHLLWSSCGKDEPESLFKIEPEEMNTRKTSLHAEINEEDSSIIQHDLEIYNKHNVDQLNPLSETSSILTMMMNEDVMGDCDSLALSGGMPKENNGIHKNIGSGTVPEEKVSVSTLPPSNHLLNNLDFLNEEHSSFISPVSKTGSALAFFGNDDLSVNTPHSLSNEQGDSDMQIGKVLVSHGAEVTENSFSSFGDVVSKPTLTVSPSSPSPSSTFPSEVAPAPQDYDIDSLSQKIECAADPLSPSRQKTSMLPPNADHETDNNSLPDNGSCSSGKPANGNEEVQSETNSMWTAIKAFVNAFIKFWSE